MGKTSHVIATKIRVRLSSFALVMLNGPCPKSPFRQCPLTLSPSAGGKKLYLPDTIGTAPPTVPTGRDCTFLTFEATLAERARNEPRPVGVKHLRYCQGMRHAIGTGDAAPATALDASLDCRYGSASQHMWFLNGKCCHCSESPLLPCRLAPSPSAGGGHNRRDSPDPPAGTHVPFTLLTFEATLLKGWG